MLSVSSRDFVDRFRREVKKCDAVRAQPQNNDERYRWGRATTAHQAAKPGRDAEDAEMGRHGDGGRGDRENDECGIMNDE